MKFYRTRLVKPPERAHATDAGIDFFVPFETEVDCYSIKPHGDIIIPSGIVADIPQNFALIAKEKSGVCVNKQLICGASVIDSGYQGEIHIHLINTSDDYVYIRPGDKIIQFLLVPVSLEPLIEVTKREMEDKKTDRGTGKFGSTGDR